MKQKHLLLSAVITFFFVVPAFSHEGTPVANNGVASSTPAPARSEELMNRLEEIKAMDTKSMSRIDKRNLRREVRSIEREMKTQDSGVYISVGAIIIIALLLIILL